MQTRDVLMTLVPYEDKSACCLLCNKPMRENEARLTFEFVKTHREERGEANSKKIKYTPKNLHKISICESCVVGKSKALTFVGLGMALFAGVICILLNISFIRFIGVAMLIAGLIILINNSYLWIKKVNNMRKAPQDMLNISKNDAGQLSLHFAICYKLIEQKELKDYDIIEIHEWANMPNG